jgi:hypothetical protein
MKLILMLVSLFTISAYSQDTNNPSVDIKFDNVHYNQENPLDMIVNQKLGSQTMVMECKEGEKSKISILAPELKSKSEDDNGVNFEVSSETCQEIVSFINKIKNNSELELCVRLGADNITVLYHSGICNIDPEQSQNYLKIQP